MPPLKRVRVEQIEGLADVATSGDFADLINPPAPSGDSNLDGGHADTIYDGIDPIEGGGA